MRIALILVCCLVSPTCLGAIALGMESLHPESDTQLTTRQKKVLGDLQEQVPDEASGSERQPQENPPLDRRREPRPVSGSHNTKPKPGPTTYPTPTPSPTVTVPIPTPPPIREPVPVPKTTPGFVVSLVLLILVGLVMLFIMGKKIYVLARGG